MIPLLPPGAPFPSFRRALREPNGLLAAGGDLSVETLVRAYARGIFPWYSETDPILWWSPDPRIVLPCAGVHVSRSLRRRVARRDVRVSLDEAFVEVVEACAAPRRGEAGTWLVPEMQAAYLAMHHHGLAHSIEVWADGRLIGGLYGVALGRMFYGESMFSRRTDGSKIALVYLAAQLL
ncbi:MAG: leucyl/phenylalanyl-tRNA--protein transferase, partial [Acidobacteriota bacterium]|nr:leucyl/phenylalanyl-tRNA--protein transferase [Acidobacteriota bacterium]